MSRISKDDYFKAIAEVISRRATCPRAKVGVVLVKDDHIIGTGYNGAPKGLDHCDDVGCLLEDNHCVRVVHAEVNAVISAARNGVNTEGAKLYMHTTNGYWEPCTKCYPVVQNAGLIIGEHQVSY